MRLTTEYLIIVERTASEAFYHLCDETSGFNKLLQTDPNIVIENSQTIQYKENLTVDYEVKTGKVEGKEQRFFLVKLTFNGEEPDFEEYAALLRSLRSIVHGAGGQPETLQDDVSFHYATKAYPLLHGVENLMRKLITYFMLTHVGKEWVTDASPSTIKEAIDKSKRKEYVDVLHQIDFIQLGDLLFKAYQTREVSELYQKFDTAEKIEDLSLDDLRDFRARSNWDRYFSRVVDCTDEYLNKRWKHLYELRCLVAHNAIVGRAEYDRILQLVSEVREALQKAVENLDKIHVPIQDRDQLAENVVSSINVLYGNFILLWKSFENTLARTTASLGGHSRLLATTKAPSALLEHLFNNHVIDNELFREAIGLVQFRNRLIHDGSPSFSEAEITSHILRLGRLLAQLRRTWKDEVANTLFALGGKASLPQIYEYIEMNSGRDLAENWQAAIRNTLQTYSSDTDSYKGGEDLFQHIEKGLWGLRSEEAEPA